MTLLNCFTKKDKLNLIVIIIATFLLYSYSITYDFVWDDTGLLIENKWINSFGWGQIWHAFIPGAVIDAIYTPITFVINFILFKLFAKSSMPFHFFSLLTYTIVVCLFYKFVIITFKNRKIALFASLLFALHPLHVETVSWICGNGYNLSALFFLLAFNIFVKKLAPDNLKTKDIILIMCFYAISLMCQPTSIVFPVLIIIYAYFFFKDKIKIAVKISIPNFVVSIVYLILTYIGVTSERYTALPMPWQSKIVLFAKNLFNVILPLDYQPLYPDSSEFQFSYIYLILSILLITVSIFIFIKFKSKIYRFFIVWFTISILPYSNIIGTLQFSTADRYAYIASIASSLFLGCIFYKIYCKANKTNQWLKYLPITLFALFYFVSSFSYSLAWANNTALWDYAYNKSPHLPRVTYNRAMIFYNKGDYDSAEKHFDRTISLNNREKQIASYIKKAQMFITNNKYDLAIDCCDKILTLEPDNMSALSLLMQVYIAEFDYKKAAVFSELAIRTLNDQKYRNYEYKQQILNDAIIINYYAGNSTNFLKYYAETMEKNCVPKEIQNGVKVQMNEDYAKAIEYYNIFLTSQNQDNFNIVKLLHIAKLQKSYKKEADSILERSAKDSLELQKYLNSNDIESAKNFMKQILSYNPYSYEINFNLGLMCYNDKDLKQAKYYLQKAYEANPSDKNILKILEKI